MVVVINALIVEIKWSRYVAMIIVIEVNLLEGDVIIIVVLICS